VSPNQFDPFDPANLRLDPEYLKSGGVKKLLTTVPVRKPNKQDFIRVHPDPDYRLCGVAIIELREDREIYLVLPSYAQQLDPQLFNHANLYVPGDKSSKSGFLMAGEAARAGRPNIWLAHFRVGRGREGHDRMDSGSAKYGSRRVRIFRGTKSVVRARMAFVAVTRPFTDWVQGPCH